MKSDHYISHHQTLSNGVKVAVREGHAVEEYILKNGTSVVIEAQNWVKPDTNASIIAFLKRHLNRLHERKHDALVRELRNYRPRTLEEIQADFCPNDPTPIRWNAENKACREAHRILNKWYNSLPESEKDVVQAGLKKYMEHNAYHPTDVEIRLTEREEAHQKKDAELRLRQIANAKEEAG